VGREKKNKNKKAFSHQEEATTTLYWQDNKQQDILR
jgi:hypothetical protein